MQFSDSIIADALAGAAAIGAAVIGARIWWSKYKGISLSDSVGEANTRIIEAGANAQTAGTTSMANLYTLLSGEVNRLTNANAELSDEVTKLHSQVNTFRQENAELLLEISRLNEQLGRLERIFIECSTCTTNNRVLTEDKRQEVTNCFSRASELSRRRRYSDIPVVELPVTPKPHESDDHMGS